jgi:hypothetical protein
MRQSHIEHCCYLSWVSVQTPSVTGTLRGRLRVNFSTKTQGLGISCLCLCPGVLGTQLLHLPVSYFSHHCDKIPDRNNLQEEGFILLMVSEGSVYGCLAPCTWAEHHGGEKVWQTGSREWGRVWGRGIIFKGMTPVTHFLQLGSTSQCFHHLRKQCTQLGIKHSAQDPVKGHWYSNGNILPLVLQRIRAVS